MLRTVSGDRKALLRIVSEGSAVLRILSEDSAVLQLVSKDWESLQVPRVGLGSEDPDSGSTSSRSSVEEKKIAKKSSLKDKFDENEFSPEDSSSSEELSQLSNKNLDGHFSVSSEVSSEDENHVLIEKDLKVTLRGYKCSKCNTFKTTLRDAIEHHLCRNIIRSARM